MTTQTIDTTTTTAIKARTNVQRDGSPVDAKVVDGQYTEAAKKALTPDIWRKAGTVVGELEENNAVTVVAMPTVEKVAEFNGKRWAWLHLTAGLKIKVYEGSQRAAALGLQFDGGKYRPAVIGNTAIVLTGIVKRMASGDLTIATPWIVTADDRDETQAELAAQTQAAFESAHTAALATVAQVYEDGAPALDDEEEDDIDG